MNHDPFITLPYRLERAPPPFEGNDIKYPESLVRHFLKRYTKPGDKIFDPFSGLGTTLFVAEELKRVPYGIEHDRTRYEWSAGQLEHWDQVIYGDSREMLSYGLPKMDFCMTSPPYMPCHHKWNPLSGGDPAQAGYDHYLAQMTEIFSALRQIMKRGSYIVVQLDNLPGKSGRRFTPLVADLGGAIGAALRQEAETIVAWDKKTAKPDYPHTHCLIFKA